MAVQWTEPPVHSKPVQVVESDLHQEDCEDKGDVAEQDKQDGVDASPRVQAEIRASMEISMGAAFSVAMEISRAWKFPWPCIIGLMQLHSTLFLMDCFYHLHGIICWCRASR